MSLLAMVAVAALIEGLLDVIFSTNLVEIHAPYINNTYQIGGLTLPAIYVYAFALSVLILAVLYVILYRTKFGVSLRATTQNPVAARLVGIVTDRVSATTLGIGVAMAAAGGMIFGATNSFNASSSYDLISRLIVIVILGGLGSIGGTLMAAVMMLVIEDVVAVVWSPLWGRPPSTSCSWWCSWPGRRACSARGRCGPSEPEHPGHPAGGPRQLSAQRALRAATPVKGADRVLFAFLLAFPVIFSNPAVTTIACSR